MLLYHGTSEANLRKIALDGIQPRYERDGNWSHTIESNAEAVYLSVAYPLYFAGQAVNEGGALSGRLVVLEIDTNKLPDMQLCADEDAVEQALRGKDDWADSSINERTAHYKSIMHQYSAEASLGVLGSCAVLGTIPVSAISRVALVEEATYSKMVVRGYDPTISVMNYRFAGELYRESTKWLFDPELVTQEYHEFGEDNRLPILPILDNRNGIQVIPATEIFITL